jgi:hypothetical protein
MRLTARATAATAVMIAALLSASCEDSKMPSVRKPAADLFSADALSRLERRTVYFGHQSVGANLLDGIRDVLKDAPGRTWAIVESEEPAKVGGPALVHSWIGRNGVPISKLEAFSDVLRRSPPGRIDVALVKFCFVDFSDQTDVPDLFRRYADTLAGLKQGFPGTTFVHVTVPLTGSPDGPKWMLRNAVKRLVGRHVRGPRDNGPINEFNDLLRKMYLGREPVFDLAALESTHADGSRVVSPVAGTSVYSLASEYTFDGGHLNERGRRMAALELLRLLASLPAKD